MESHDVDLDLNPDHHPSCSMRVIEQDGSKTALLVQDLGAIVISGKGVAILTKDEILFDS